MSNPKRRTVVDTQVARLRSGLDLDFTPHIIRHSRDGMWYAVFEYHGERKFRLTGHRDEGRALAACFNLLKELIFEKAREEGAICTPVDAVQTYLRYTVGLKQTTLDNYTNIAWQFVDHLSQAGVKYLHEITTQQIDDFIVKPTTKGAPSRTTRTARRTVVTEMMNCAYRAKLTTSHLYPMPIKFKGREHVESKSEYLRYDELEQVLMYHAHADSDRRMFVRYFMLDFLFGARSQELRLLRIDQIEKFSTAVFPVTKQGREHTLDLDRNAVGIIREQIQWKNSHPNSAIRLSPFLFPCRTGAAYDSGAMGRAIKTLQLEVFPGRRLNHLTMRHTTATYLYEHGVSIEEIRLRMGHSSERMTWYYIRTRHVPQQALSVLNAIPDPLRFCSLHA